MSQTRRLAAILAADVAGYSRLMGADEEGTLERLKALRRELLDPKIAERHGRIVKTTGDGLLVEFASVVDAVRCAVEVQQAMPERDTSVAADNRIELRIGINLGDVIVEGDDLMATREHRGTHRSSQLGFFPKLGAFNIGLQGCRSGKYTAQGASAARGNHLASPVQRADADYRIADPVDRRWLDVIKVVPLFWIERAELLSVANIHDA
jgi:Adenylate and Guanylate cyclase catalytic domain